MKIVLIGSGNVATHLGLALNSNGHQIVQVYSRSEANAKVLSDRLNAKAISDLLGIDQKADLYILSVKDDALESVVDLLPQLNGIVVHTAGSISADVLVRFNKYGVFYPFQTFTKESDIDFKSVPILVESNDETVTNQLYQLGQELSNTVLRASSNQRGQLHIAAVYACNFVNHMYRLADEVLQENGLPFDLLHPLITETAAKVQKIAPSKTQTGPGARNDQKIIQKHINALSGNDELQNIYKVLTDSVIRRL